METTSLKLKYTPGPLFGTVLTSSDVLLIHLYKADQIKPMHPAFKFPPTHKPSYDRRRDTSTHHYLQPIAQTDILVKCKQQTIERAPRLSKSIYITKNNRIGYNTT